MSVEIVNFGCRLNIYEGEVMREHAEQAALSDTIIVNSCAVTAEAERQVRQTIRRMHREHPHKRIVVTGCAAQIHADEFAQMPEVSKVVGNEEKMHAGTFMHLFEREEKAMVNDIMSVEETASHMVAGFDGRARAFVQVQNGCNHRCTFCIIPFGRGNSRSVPVGEIVTQVRALVASGYQEVVLTGVDITAYGEDLPGQPALGHMIKRLLTLVPSLPRLRLSSLDAVEMDDTLWDLIAHEPRLMPHLHVSLQAGDNMVLKRMKRRHLREDALAFCEKARQLRPDVVFGADIIAGFPTESDAMFDNTCAFIEQAQLTYLHIFPFSPRPGTPAAKMPQVKGGKIKARAKALREIGARQLKKHCDSLVGSEQMVIMEKGHQGRTEYFTLCNVQSDSLHKALAPGAMARVKIVASNDDAVVAVPL